MVYIMKIKGPRTEPYVTPKTRGWGSERESQTDWLLLELYEQNQLWTQPGRLDCEDNSLDSCWWSIVSKAANKSNRTTILGLFGLNGFNIISYLPSLISRLVDVIQFICSKMVFENKLRLDTGLSLFNTSDSRESFLVSGVTTAHLNFNPFW